MLNRDVVYSWESYIAQKSKEVGTDTGSPQPTVTEPPTIIYNTIPIPTNRQITRLLTHSHIVNYFLAQFRCPEDAGVVGHQQYPKGLLSNPVPIQQRLDSGADATADAQPNQISFYEKTITNNGLTHGVEINAYSSILGGVISQEILRTFQRVEQTILNNNWLYLDIFTSTGECTEVSIM